MMKPVPVDIARHKHSSFSNISKARKLLFLLALILSTSMLYAQEGTQPRKVGKVDQFYESIRLSEAQIKTRKAKVSSLETPVGTLSASINVSKVEDGVEHLIGEVKGKTASSVAFEFGKGKFNGLAVLPEERKAFKYYSDESGDVYVQEEDINKVLCIDFNKTVTPDTRAVPQPAPPVGSTVYTLQSLPGAVAVAYLDFDGQVVTGTRWNGGNTINALPGNYSETDVTNIWKMISEDYRPFNINITTDVAVFNAAPKGRRIRCIFTPTNTAAPGSGGVAYVNSFRWTDDTPCWVFNSGSKGGGEAGSHEIGHTLGLSHDGRTSPKEDYYAGQGIWAPIMGVGYSKGLVQWSKGEYANANQTQDDIAIISSTSNGFGFRTDEAGNTDATAKALVVASNGSVSASQNYGVIAQRTDIDVYSFTTSGGAVTLTITPAASYPDLDIVAVLRNASGTTVTTVNPTASAPGSQTGTNPITGLSASLSVNLAAGKYYLQIDGTGQGDPLTTGYSDYASLGEYSISGTVPNTTVNLRPVVDITSPANNASFTAPATISVAATASDPDGTVSSVAFYNGSTLLGTDATSPYSFSWTNVATGSYEIKAIVTDNNGGTSRDSVMVTVNPAVNSQPVVRITSPVSNATFAAPASIAFAVTASDPDGTVSSVAFYNGTTLLGTDVTSPYSFSWTNVAAGTYFIRAVATDNNGAVGNDTVTVVVNPTINSQPVVRITTPVSNATFTAPASIAFSVTASDPDGTVSSVAFYNGTTLLGTDVTSPYNFSWTNVAAGSYFIKVVATDNNGAVGNDTVTVLVNPASNQLPSVSITSPINNTKVTAPASITITATASDPDGSVNSVAFYNGTTLIGTDNTAPYSFTITGAQAGTFALTAVATDNLGGKTTSSIVMVNVENVLSAGINGPACINVGQRVLYVLSPEASFSNANWWTNAQAVIEVDPTDKKRVYVTYNANIASVNLSVGVNYNVAPWYKQYDKAIQVGGCPAASSIPASTLFRDLDSEALSSEDEKLISIKVYDYLGNEIIYNGELTMEIEKIKEGLGEGTYLFYAVTDKRIIRKKLAIVK